MAKAIILVRVSTESQSFEQQTKDLVAVAIRDGYDEKDLIIIENKESATKKDEEQRLGLVEMKAQIENDPSINCVYVREVSRIGRRYDVLSGIKNYLVTNKIQLIVAGDSRIELLDKKGKITLQGNLMFEIACSVAENEMADKALRFQQGKRKAVEEGKTVSGRVLLGYRIDEKTKKIEVDDENYGNTASIIKDIFYTYTSTAKSTKAIYKELVCQGRFNRMIRDDVGANQICRIIRNKAYSGGYNDNGVKESRKVYNYHYPPIVSKEIQEAAIEKCINAKKLPKYTQKHLYYAKSLLKCGCGHVMIGDSFRGAYKCPYCKKHVLLNTIDYIAWLNAIVLKTKLDENNYQTTIQGYEDEIRKNEKTIEFLNSQLEELDEKDANILLRSATMPNQTKADEVVKKVFAENEAERKVISQERLRLDELNRQMKQYIKNYSTKIDPTYTGKISSIENDEMRRDIIQEVIDHLQLEYLDSKHTKITIIPKQIIMEKYPFYYIIDKTTNPYQRVYSYFNEKFDKDITKDVFNRYHKPLPKRKRLAKEEKLKRIGNKMSINEVRDKYGYSRTHVYSCIQKEVLKAEMINRKFFIEPDEAERVFGGK